MNQRSPQPAEEIRRERALLSLGSCAFQLLRESACDEICCKPSRVTEKKCKNYSANRVALWLTSNSGTTKGATEVRQASERKLRSVCVELVNSNVTLSYSERAQDTHKERKGGGKIHNYSVSVLGPGSHFHNLLSAVLSKCSPPTWQELSMISPVLGWQSLCVCARDLIPKAAPSQRLILCYAN